MRAVSVKYLDMDDAYFDYAATAPPFEDAVSRFARVTSEAFGNPSSSHAAGKQARATLEAERRAFLDLAGLPGGTLVLTSGATEANNLVIRGVLEANPDGRLLLAADAHPSAWFARDLYGKRTDLLETGSDGRISAETLASRLSKKHVLVSIVHANNETGVVQDLKALGAVCSKTGVALHVDGVQALGRFPVTLADLPFAFYTFSAHKFGGVRGTGGVILREGTLKPQILGGGQEGGARAGTENVAGLAAAVTALGRSREAFDIDVPRLRRLARLLADDLRAGVPGAILNSDADAGVPGLVSVSFPDLLGEEIVVELNLRGFAVSAGSACGSGRMEPSRPVMAMGRTRAQALGTVRISMGRGTTEASMRRLAAELKSVVAKQKALA